jgi:hypothetical protein
VVLENDELVELRGEEAYQEWKSLLWREEEMREEGMRINGDSSPAFIQILLPMYPCTYVRTLTTQ